MTKPYRSHDEAMAESLGRDPDFAAAYVNAILEDGDESEMMLALRQLALARGGMQHVAEEAGMNQTAIYKTLSPQGNPELRTLTRVLRALGLRLSVEPDHRTAHA